MQSSEASHLTLIEEPVKPSDPVHLQQIYPHELEDLWPSIETWLSDVVDEFGLGRMQTKDWRHQIEENESQLFVIWAKLERRPLAVFVTQFQDYPKARVCSIPLLRGHSMRRWTHLLRDVELWAQRNGCTQMEIPGRRGWGRIYPDYEPRYSVFTKELV